MRVLLRPLTWLILAEILVVGGLAAAAWHVASGRLPASAASRLGELPSSLLPGAATATTAPSPPPAVVVTAPTPRRAGPTPGLALSSRFLDSELRTINRDQSAWERSQWTIVQAVLGLARAYIDGVVLPGVRAAESGGR